MNLIKAIQEISAIARKTFADGLPRDEGAPALAAAMPAQLADLFARDYGFWPLPQPIRHTPIKQLYQMARCHDRVNGSKSYFDPDEARLTAGYLEQLNREAIAANRATETANRYG